MIDTESLDVAKLGELKGEARSGYVRFGQGRAAAKSSKGAARERRGSRGDEHWRAAGAGLYCSRRCGLFK